MRWNWGQRWVLWLSGIMDNRSEGIYGSGLKTESSILGKAAWTGFFLSNATSGPSMGQSRASYNFCISSEAGLWVQTRKPEIHGELCNVGIHLDKAKPYPFSPGFLGKSSIKPGSVQPQRCFLPWSCKSSIRAFWRSRIRLDGEKNGLNRFFSVSV